MALHLEVYRLDEMDESDVQVIRDIYGALDDVAFVVYWRKYVDDSYNGYQWNGWPFTRGGYSEPVRVDDPRNWKTTWFLFLD